jgi:uncharacterized protein YebE (UPF0316 family)
MYIEEMVLIIMCCQITMVTFNILMTLKAHRKANATAKMMVEMQRRRLEEGEEWKE